MITVYKVVAVTLSGALRSFNTPEPMRQNDAVNKLALDYTPGKEVKPEIEGSKLFAFDTVDNALRFRAFRISAFEVWKAETESAEPLNGVIWFPATAFFQAEASRAEKLWRNGKLEGCPDSYRELDVPYGTVLCPSLKLTERVEKSERAITRLVFDSIV